jgi:hypothetical protein
VSIPKTSPQVNLIRRPSLAQMGIPMPNAVNVQRTASMSMPPNEMGFNPYAQQMMPPQMMPNSMLGSQQAVNMQNYDMVRPSNMQPPNMGPGGPGMVSPHNMLPQQSFSPNLPDQIYDVPRSFGGSHMGSQIGSGMGGSQMGSQVGFQMGPPGHQRQGSQPMQQPHMNNFNHQQGYVFHLRGWHKSSRLVHFFRAIFEKKMWKFIFFIFYLQ